MFVFWPMSGMYINIAIKAGQSQAFQAFKRPGWGGVLFGKNWNVFKKVFPILLDYCVILFYRKLDLLRLGGGGVRSSIHSLRFVKSLVGTHFVKLNMMLFILIH